MDHISCRRASGRAQAGASCSNLQIIQNITSHPHLRQTTLELAVLNSSTTKDLLSKTKFYRRFQLQVRHFSPSRSLSSGFLTADGRLCLPVPTVWAFLKKQKLSSRMGSAEQRRVFAHGASRIANMQRAEASSEDPAWTKRDAPCPRRKLDGWNHTNWKV